MNWIKFFILCPVNQYFYHFLISDLYFCGIFVYTLRFPSLKVSKPSFIASQMYAQAKKNLSPDFHNLWKQCCWCSALIFFSFFGLSPNDVTNIMGVVQFNFERVSGWSSNVTHSLKWVGIIFEFVFLFSSTCIFSDYFFNIHFIVLNKNLNVYCKHKNR